MRTLLLPLAVLGLTGCYSEGIEIHNLRGVVKVPKSAAVFTPGRGEAAPFAGVKAIGPVYIGLYSDIRDDIELYPHPERGPAIAGSSRGTSFPYGGTTVGDFRNACFEFFTCKVVSGRFTTYQEIIDWFTDEVGEPPEDEEENIITTGERIRQSCFELLEYRSDEEIRVLGSDADGSGTVEPEELDFVDGGDFWEAEFDILQAEFFPGMTAWAFMDQANAIGHNFDTCNPNNGYFENTYARQYQAGVQQPDVLNSPYNYISDNDWVSSLGFVWNDPDEVAEIVIDLRAGGPEGDN